MCGAVTIFTTCKKLSDKEIMATYRAKESVEDCFDTTKNGLSDNDKRLHVQGDAQVEGKMFVMFLGLVLTRILMQRLKMHMDQGHFTLQDELRELKKIRFFKDKKGKWITKNSLTKTQKELLSCLDLKSLKQPKLTTHPRVRHARVPKTEAPIR